MTDSSERRPWTGIALALVACAIIAVLRVHLTLAFMAGMLVYVAGRRLTEWLQRRSRLPHPSLWSVAILAALAAGAGSMVVERGAALAGNGSGVQGLIEHMADAIGQLRTTLPSWLAAQVPASLEALRAAAVPWLQRHASQVGLWGQQTLGAVTYALAGAVVGALAVIEVRPARARWMRPTPWIAALNERFQLFEEAFGAVVFAQFTIAAINTVLTGIYVLVVLPALGASLPFAVTLVALSFATGLIPVVGNLVSNTVIVVVSLTHGVAITSLSLGFLVAIHKLEYLLNARIVGGRIGTKAWDLLAAMLAFEAFFGLGGLVMAPIVYAYARAELRRAGWLKSPAAAFHAKRLAA
jgi:predicted PurR-regulated permease PerM